MMLERSEYMPMEYIKKQKWTGSYRGMRFMLHKVIEKQQEEVDGETKEVELVRLEAVIWKEPYSYEATVEEGKTRQRFEFSDEGREMAITWLEQEYDNRQEEWKQAMKWDWETEQKQMLPEENS